ncbi:OmpP1/FadL family transporter [Lujinxingia litoralis]|nr:outer membrane protein transport protein [Lujinxingia litoralis]
MFVVELRRLWASTLVMACALAGSSSAMAAGFEVGENTARSLARGGTGAVNKADASALYFNPALLPRARGHQILFNTNATRLNLGFERDDLILRGRNETRRVSFDRVENQGGFFPAPFVTASFDVGPENFALALGAFGPSAYGTPCYGTREDGECNVDPESPARGMLVGENLFLAYFSLGAGYEFDLGEDRSLAIGLTAIAAYQDTSFSIAVESDPNVAPPWQEDPRAEAYFQAEELRAWRPSGILGIAYQDGPMRLAASYRPPIHWETKGKASVALPDFLTSTGAYLTDEAMTFSTWQAGSLRLGWGVELGEHPADPAMPRFDLEVNAVWENWSLVDYFKIEMEGDIELADVPPDEEGNPPVIPIYPIYQVKNYQDAYSLRLGGSYGVNRFLSAHGGAMMETPAQRNAHTTVDFVSWERYGLSAGATVHLPANLELELGYMHIFSPSRRVSQGAIYNPIPMSQCAGPDFDHSSCEEPGTPPGNPQNEGTWNASFQILSAGLTWRY